MTATVVVRVVVVAAAEVVKLGSRGPLEQEQVWRLSPGSWPMPSELPAWLSEWQGVDFV